MNGAINETSLSKLNAIYENINNMESNDTDTDESPTRVRVASLPVLIERITNMPDALRVEFRVSLPHYYDYFE